MTDFIKYAEILDEAADVVDAGWCQGKSQDYYGNYCAIGAITKVVNYALRNNYDIYEATALLQEYGKIPSITEWNDAPKRRKHEVSRKLRYVARLLRKKAEKNNG